jgi:hypothetical protein
MSRKDIPALKRRIQSGELVGPRILAAGKVLDGPGSTTARTQASLSSRALDAALYVCRSNMMVNQPNPRKHEAAVLSVVLPVRAE